MTETAKVARGYSDQMNAALVKFSYPCSKVTAEGDVEADNIVDYGDVIEAMLML